MSTRTSKFRHVFGTTFKKDFCYENVKASESAWDGNFIKANAQYFAVAWQVGGGGAFAVIPHAAVGRRTDQPLFTGHTRPVLDFDFHPFNDNLIVSGAEDATVKLWQIPEGGPTEHIADPLSTLAQFSKKVGFVLFHPSAANVLAAAAMDPIIKVLDVEDGGVISTMTGFGDLIQSIDWNRDGSLLGTTCKDKKIRLFDPHTGAIAQETEGHKGPKSSRFVFLKDQNKAFSVGFGVKNDRQYMTWDLRNFSAPVLEENLDSDTGLPMLLYDYDTGIAFMGGKGEASIKYYDLNTDKPYPLGAFQSTTPQRGLCMAPKRILDISHCEIVRMLKLTRTNTVEPIRFENPRKDETFQADLFPDTAGPEPALTAAEFKAGSNAAPKLISLDPAAGATKTFVPYTFVVSTPPASATSVKPVSGGAATAPSPTPASEDLAAKVAELTARIAALEAENAALHAENAALKGQ